MENGAPYLRIVGEIRDRIASGRLRPGDRVPSTRQITQQWGVAMATATKVISTLRDEGLVDTKPGAGTVVRSAQSREDIGRDRIIRAGIALADAEGLGAVSMRRLATDLGVATMSLYRYVSSKDDLVVFMADTAFGEVAWPARPVAGWRPRLELAGRLMWTVCRRHPWVAEVLSMTRPRGTPQLLVYAEWVLSTLHALGLPMDDMMHIHLTLFGHVKAIALALSAEVRARQDTGIGNDEWMQQQETEFRAALTGGSFPTMEYITTLEWDQDLDRMFEYGLRMLLDGLDTYVNAHNYTAKNDHAG